MKTYNVTVRKLDGYQDTVKVFAKGIKSAIAKAEKISYVNYTIRGIEV